MKFKRKCILVAAAGLFLSLLFFAMDMRGREELTFLTRPGQGEEDTSETLEMRLDGESYEVDIPLYALPYEEGELQSMLERAADSLEEIFLCGNADLEHISSSVSMPSELADSGISVQWYLNSYDTISLDGTVDNLGLEEGVPVQVQAVLSCEGQKLNWQREAVVIPPSELSGEEKAELIQRQLALQQDGMEQEVPLPAATGGTSLQWYTVSDGRWQWMLGLTLIALLGLFLGKQKDEEKLLRQREMSMQRDYPDIVSRLSLYMGAGISMRNSWERIVEKYEQSKEEPLKRGGFLLIRKSRNEISDTTGRPAYEEMRTTLHEMQSGISESAAYERFGTRCRVPAYLKLGTLLSQNLRKGTKNLASLLAEESREAFENRKAYAKKLGEECESKLLLPMLLLLLAVLITVMYPAVTSFQME